tara:strand:- start:2353 stop:2580 length:228 start_codon:yes stop_codon:yes gene_type:complete
MKDIKDIKKHVAKLSETEITTLKAIQNNLTNIQKKPTVSEDGLRVLENCLSELEIFRNNYTWRLIRLLKQNHMID